MMPRNGSGVYARPVGTDAVTDTTIESEKYNVNVADVEHDLNLPRPIVAGGTGGTSAPEALFNLKGETCDQLVTNYDSHIFLPGSFRSATTATGAPVAGHAFAGIAYLNEALVNPPTNGNLVIEVRDQTDTTPAWALNTNYGVNAGAVDSADSSRWVCVVNHVSPASGTFAAYRTANPTHWIAGRGPGRVYARDKRSGVWGAWVFDQQSVYVSQTGDTMTGALRVGAAFPVPPYAQTVSAGNLSTDVNVAFNSFINAAGTTWMAQKTGYGARLELTAANGLLAFYSSNGSSPAGTTHDPFSVTATLSHAGLLSTTNLRLEGNNFGALTIYKDGSTTDYGSIGHANNDGHFSINSTGQPIGLYTAGTLRVNVAQSGSVTISEPTANVPGLLVNGTSTASNYAIDGRANKVDTAGIIGWSINNTAYGQCGAHHVAAYYSFYGVGGAFISGGTWATSDGRLKAVADNVDTSQALAAVNAIAVKQYTAATPAASSALAIEGNETLYGWVAQDVEALVPIAVRDVGIPAHDLASRAAIRGIAIPEKDSKEAIALSEGTETVKAINDRYMLTTLWAAVQQLSAQNNEMRAELETLKTR
jgi:hypothetical protein